MCKRLVYPNKGHSYPVAFYVLKHFDIYCILWWIHHLSISGTLIILTSVSFSVLSVSVCVYIYTHVHIYTHVQYTYMHARQYAYTYDTYLYDPHTILYHIISYIYHTHIISYNMPQYYIYTIYHLYTRIRITYIYTYTIYSIDLLIYTYINSFLQGLLAISVLRMRSIIFADVDTLSCCCITVFALCFYVIP